jgi:hypothetical protein
MQISNRTFFYAVALAGALVLSATATKATQVIVGTHYEETLTVNCPAAKTECALAMTAVPAGKNLLVTKISCTMSYSNGPIHPSYFQFGHKTPAAPRANLDKGSEPFTFLALNSVQDLAPSFIYAVNVDANQMFTTGQVPYFYHALNDGKFNTFKCSIFGTLMPNIS